MALSLSINFVVDIFRRGWFVVVLMGPTVLVVPLIGLPLRVGVRIFLVRVQLIIIAPVTLSLAIAAGEFNFRLVSDDRLVMVVMMMLGLVVVNQRCIIVVLRLIPVIIVMLRSSNLVRHVLIDG